MPCHAPAAARTTWSSTRDDGVETITLAPSELAPACAAPPCTLYVGVRGVTDSSFTLVVSQRASGVASLVPGVPQAGSVPPGATHYFYTQARAPSHAHARVACAMWHAHVDMLTC